MKKIIAAILLAVVLLTTGCAPKTEGSDPSSLGTLPSEATVSSASPTVSAPAAAKSSAPASVIPTQVPSAIPSEEPSISPEFEKLFLVWNNKGEKKANLFELDFNSDGKKESVSLWTNTLDQHVLEIDGIAYHPEMVLETVIAAHLSSEPDSLRLIISGDKCSEDYISQVLEFKNGKIKCQTEINGEAYAKNGKIYVKEMTDMLGTRWGTRQYKGLPLKAASSKLTVNNRPSKKDIEKVLSGSMSAEDAGLMLVVKEIPAFDGQTSAVIPVGSYVYPVAFSKKPGWVEVQVVNGKILRIEVKNEDYEYLINGIRQDEYFESVPYSG